MVFGPTLLQVFTCIFNKTIEIDKFEFYDVNDKGEFKKLNRYKPLDEHEKGNGYELGEEVTEELKSFMTKRLERLK